jgi:hypothetical protein
MMTNATIEATTRARAPRMTLTTITVIWELPVGGSPLPPLLVGMGVFLGPVFVDVTLDDDVGVGMKVLIDGEDGEGGV